MWIGDVGWNDWEELNVLAAPTSAVQNFGWPCYEGVDPQPGYQFTFLDICSTLYDTPDAVSAPLLTYYHGDPVVAGDGCAIGSSAISGSPSTAAAATPRPTTARSSSPTTAGTASG